MVCCVRREETYALKKLVDALHVLDLLADLVAVVLEGERRRAAGRRIAVEQLAVHVVLEHVASGALHVGRALVVEVAAIERVGRGELFGTRGRIEAVRAAVAQLGHLQAVDHLEHAHRYVLDDEVDGLDVVAHLIDGQYAVDDELAARRHERGKDEARAVAEQQLVVHEQRLIVLRLAGRLAHRCLLVVQQRVYGRALAHVRIADETDGRAARLGLVHDVRVHALEERDQLRAVQDFALFRLLVVQHKLTLLLLVARLGRFSVRQLSNFFAFFFFFFCFFIVVVVFFLLVVSGCLFFILLVVVLLLRRRC